MNRKSQVVEYFLKKDVEIRQQARRKARLEAQAKVSLLFLYLLVLAQAKVSLFLLYLFRVLHKLKLAFSFLPFKQF